MPWMDTCMNGNPVHNISQEEMKAWKEKVAAAGFHDDNEAHHDDNKHS